jgi:hypothetical protein
MLPTKFRFIWPSGFGEDLNKSANQKQENEELPLDQINRNLIGSIYGMSSMNNAHFVPID